MVAEDGFLDRNGMTFLVSDQLYQSTKANSLTNKMRKKIRDKQAWRLSLTKRKHEQTAEMMIRVS